MRIFFQRIKLYVRKIHYLIKLIIFLLIESHCIHNNKYSVYRINARNLMSDLFAINAIVWRLTQSYSYNKNSIK
jgi:uncharacterized membrane protein